MKRKFPSLLSIALTVVMVAAMTIHMGPTEVFAKSNSVTPAEMGDNGCLISVEIDLGQIYDDGQIDLTIDTGYSTFNAASMWYEADDAGLEVADTVITDAQASELVTKGIQGLTVKLTGDAGVYINYIKIDLIQYWLKPDSTYGFKTLNEWDYYTGKWFDSDSTSSYGTPDTLNYEKVTISTADENNAGTDMVVKIWLKDKEGRTSGIVELNNCMELEKGNVEEIYISVPKDFTDTQKMCMECWQNGDAMGWKIKSVSFEKTGRTITPNLWILEPTADDYITFGLDPGTTSIFKHTVKTANSDNAGTDSNIYFEIRQDNNNWTNAVRISDYDHNAGIGNGFEKDDTDVFAIAYNGEGWSNINHLRITKDDSGWGPDWKPQYVELVEIVADDAAGNTYRFDINEFIEDETVEYGDAYPSFILTSVQQHGWQNILENLKSGTLVVKTEDGFVLDEEVVQLLKDKGIVLKVEFVDGEQSLGIYTIDGTLIKEVKNINLSKELVAGSSNEASSPKTGDISNNSLVYAGLFMLAGVCVTVSVRRKNICI